MTTNESDSYSPKFPFQAGSTTTWNAYIDLAGPVSPEDTLAFSVVHVDHNPATKNERLGACTVPVSKLMADEVGTPQVPQTSFPWLNRLSLAESLFAGARWPPYPFPWNTSSRNELKVSAL